MTLKKQKASAVTYNYLYHSTCSSSHIMNCKVKKGRLIAENKFCVTENDTLHLHVDFLFADQDLCKVTKF